MHQNSNPRRTAAGLCPAPVPLRQAPEGSALWTPAGVNDPRPRDADASPPRLRAGRRIWYGQACQCTLPVPPKGGRDGWFSASQTDSFF